LFLSRTDKQLTLWLRLCALISATVLALIILFLLAESWPLLKHDVLTQFISDGSWHPAQGLYNIMPMLSATLLSTLGALALATPLGIASALFNQYYAPPFLASGYRRMIELLAGIPSVVYGLWGLTALAPVINQWHPPGVSLLCAILVLAIMILPTVTLTVDATLAAIPTAFHQNAAALGLSRWSTIRHVLLPAAKSGIGVGIMLATGRAIGETMAVLMVAGNVVQQPHSLFDSVRTLSANIALEMAFATGDHRAALFVSGLALMLMIILLVSLAEINSQRSFHVS